MPIQRGDILNPREWTGKKWNWAYEPTAECPNGVLFRVIGFEHQIIQKEDETITRHIIMVYTEDMDDVEENKP